MTFIRCILLTMAGVASLEKDRRRKLEQIREIIIVNKPTCGTVRSPDCKNDNKSGWFNKLVQHCFKSPVKMLNLRIIRFCLLLFSCVSLGGVLGTISPSSKTKGKSKAKEYNVKTGPTGTSVFDRNLIDEEPSSKAIIIENEAYHEDTSLRNFNGTILGYVTPVCKTRISHPETFSNDLF